MLFLILTNFLSALTFSNYALSLFMSDKDAGFEILQKIIATCAIGLYSVDGKKSLLTKFVQPRKYFEQNIKTLILSLPSALIIAVNSYSTRIGIVMQNTFTVLKLAALSVLILMGFTQLCMGRFFYNSDPLPYSATL